MINLFDDTKPLSLSMLNTLVKEAIEVNMPDQYWVQAELASVRENRGHCYMELIEKDSIDGSLRAQARACCWKNTWMRVGRKFTEATGAPLHAGMKVLMLVHANFHEAFGFSWIVEDIDPTFTLGDMEQRRREILRKLREEGVIDLQKQLRISPFCKRIAVISSATAAGYGDFCNQLADNGYGFQFETQLFPAIMQGEQVESSIVAALDKVFNGDFDCLVIIRGGGSTADLSGFDTLALAENVANFPLPIITGIGHDRDQSVLDIVACVSVKTPTAVAEFLISNLATTLERVETCSTRLTIATQQYMEREKMRIQSLAQRIDSSSERRLLIEDNRLKLLAQRIEAVDPVNILRKGYSITLHNGVSVKDAAMLKEGDEVKIMFATGTAEALVK